MIEPVLDPFMIAFGKDVLDRYHFFSFMIVEILHKIWDLLELQPLVEQQAKTTGVGSRGGRVVACDEHGGIIILHNPALVNFFANVVQHLRQISNRKAMETVQQFRDSFVEVPVEQHVS